MAYEMRIRDWSSDVCSSDRYPQRSESPHDVVESSHASSSLSWADGVSRAFSRTGRRDRHVVAVVGDGAPTGGMTWEALHNITDDHDLNLVIAVNDNGQFGRASIKEQVCKYVLIHMVA